MYYYEIVKVRCGFQIGGRKTIYIKLHKTFIDFYQFCIAGSKVVRQQGYLISRERNLSFFNSTAPRIFGEANGVKIKLQGKKKNGIN